MSGFFNAEISANAEFSASQCFGREERASDPREFVLCLAKIRSRFLWFFRAMNSTPESRFWRLREP